MSFLPFLLAQLPIAPPKTPPTSLDLNFLISVLLFLGALLGGGYFLYLQTRESRMKVAQEAAEGWERLYRLRETEMHQLTRRVAELESRIEGLRRENDDFRSLNLELQRENQDLRAEVKRLMGRIEELERHPRGELRSENDELKLELQQLRRLLRSHGLVEAEADD